MEKKDVVSKKTSKLLIRKGFKSNDGDDAIPLWDAQEWLRSKRINIYIYLGMDGYNFDIVRQDEDGLFIDKSDDDYYPTYEKCLDKAILKSLRYIPDVKEYGQCMFCDNYDDGHCTNFGNEVDADSTCKHYQRTIVERVCQNCGRKYDPSDSDADDKDSFCCKACEYGY